MKISFANVAASITVTGIVAQVAAYVAASGYYANFNITPDQIGITPLNALQKLVRTGLLSASFVMIVALLSLGSFAVLQRWWYRRPAGSSEVRDLLVEQGLEMRRTWRRGGLYVVRPAISRSAARLTWNLILCAYIGLVVVGIPTIAHGLGSSAGSRAKETASAGVARVDPTTGAKLSVYANTASSNPVWQDLNPPLCAYHWVKNEEYPNWFFVKGDLGGRTRVGLLIGMNGGLTFIYDRDEGHLLVVPSSQVQMSIL
ncbi:hypothetical protein [Amycolatopsis sp. NPDC004772]